MKVKALEKYYYARKEYAPGEEFEIDDREAMNVDLLCRLGKLEVVIAASKPVTAAPVTTTTYETTSIESETEEVESSDSDVSKKRVYRRRDMRPER